MQGPGRGGKKARGVAAAFGLDFLAQAPRDWLIAHFGNSYGAWLHEASHGRDDRPVVTHSEPVTLSRETTFERDLHAVQDREALGAIFTRLCEQVAQDLQRKGYLGRTIGIKLRYDNFKSVTRDQSIEFYTADAATLRRVAGLCLKRVDLQRRLRLLGVRVSSLVPSDGLNQKPWSALHATPPDQPVQEELPGLHADASRG
jgi:DNA polymerase-4